MLARRIIPCLDVKDGRVVKGTNFEGLRDMADPVEMARFYNESGADELVFYDITASAEGRNLFTDILRRVAGEIFIPLTVGGGIRTLEDFDRVLKCGADKVSVNSGAIADPAIIGAAAMAALQQLLDTHPQVLREPEEPIVRVKEQADSAIVLLARFWCANADYWNLQYDLLQQVKLTFDDKGISIPFPQMDVHVK